MKKLLIVGLVCVNIALILALVLSQGGQTAVAQHRPAGPGKYLVVTGKIGTDSDVVYVIDLDKRKFTGWSFDDGKKAFVKYGTPRKLADDFNPEK